MLKGFWKRWGRGSIWCVTKHLIRELRYAWLRAWRGYDDVDVFALSDRFLERIILTLKEFRKEYIGMFPNHDNIDEFDLHNPEMWLSQEKTNKIIDEMIYCFDNSDSDKLLRQLNGGIDKETGKLDIELINKYYTIALNNRKRGLELFVKYFDSLWY